MIKGCALAIVATSLLPQHLAPLTDQERGAAFTLGQTCEATIIQIAAGEYVIYTKPSHGIIEPLRARFPEFTFDSLPDGPFDVVVVTTKGGRRYHVTDAVRHQSLHVCNR